jgi:hypothetical protein
LSGETAEPKHQRPRGLLSARTVRHFSFWTAIACLVVPVLAAILAIWEFTGTDVLWRTVATCAVIGAGTLTFARINGLFGDDA